MKPIESLRITKDQKYHFLWFQAHHISYKKKEHIHIKELNLKMLSGRLAWVTGAGGGIGREICRILALEGANVVVDDIEQSKCLETITVSISLLVNLELRKNFLIEKFKVI